MKKEMKDLLFGRYYPAIMELMTEFDIAEMERTITDLYCRYDILPPKVERKQSEKERLHAVFKMYYDGGWRNFSFGQAEDKEKWKYIDWLEKFIYHYAQITL